MPDFVLPTTMTVRQAVVDDTQRLWIAFADGMWLWVDLAGYLDEHKAAHPLPFLAIQDGMDLWLTPDISLPLLLLFWPREPALERGVYVCATSRSFESWYRPLHLSQAVELTQPHRPAQWLAQLLNVSSQDFQQAASAHGVDLPIFIRRLADLCRLLQDGGQPAMQALRSPQPLLQKLGGPPTLWQIILQGKIGLAEQWAVAMANRLTVQPNASKREDR